MADLLSVIARFEAIYHLPPTLEEIGERVGWRLARTQLRAELLRLEAAGRLVRRRDPRANRALTWGTTARTADGRDGRDGRIDHGRARTETTDRNES